MKKISINIAALAMGLALTAFANADYYSNPNSYSNSAPTSYRGEATLSDQDLLKKIHDKIGPGWFSQGYDQVKAQVNNGVVTLRGSVKTWKDKEKVEADVRNIHGVRSLNSQISIEEPSTSYTYRDTQTYQSTGQPAYAQSGQYPSYQQQPNVYTQSGQYQPYQQSTTYRDMQTYQSNGYKNQSYAYRDAQAQDQDFPQDNFATAADEQLNKKIRDNVSKGWFTNSYKDISLNTQNGLVTLEGTVNDFNDQQKLIMEIQKIDGVKGVRSNLRINNR